MLVSKLIPRKSSTFVVVLDLVNTSIPLLLLFKARYGLPPSAEKFSTVLVRSLPVTGFKPNRFDSHVWTRMCDSRDGYAYICTRADVFKVMAMDSTIFMVVPLSRMIVAQRLSSP